MKYILLFSLMLCTMFSNAAIKTWVGASGDNWQNSNSWSPAGVPGTNDDIIFNTSGTVLFTSSVVGIRSLLITNNVIVAFEAGGVYKLGSVVGAPLIIDAGSTLQVRSLNSTTAGLSLEVDGNCRIDGTLDLQGGSNSKLALYSGIATTAHLTVNGTIRTGYLVISNINAEAGGVSGTNTSAGINFNSGSVYEIAKSAGTISIPPAVWDANAKLLITGAQSASGLALSYSGASAHELGTVEWNCSNQGGIGSLGFSSFPYVTAIKGDFIIGNSNNKIVRLSSSSSTSYTVTFKGDFNVVNANTTLEMFSSTASLGAGIGTWIFQKNVNVASGLNTGNTSSTAHQLRFEGTASGQGGSGAQLLSIGALQPAGAFNLTVNNGGNDVSLKSNVGMLKNIALTNGKIYLGNYNLIGGGNAGTVTRANTSSWIVTNGTGVLTIAIPAAAGRVFPIGISTTSADLAAVTPVSNDTFSIRVKNTFTNPVADPTKVYNREWLVSSKSTQATLELYPDPIAAAAPVGTGADVVGHYTGTAWTETNSLGAGDNLLAGYSASFNSFSPFAVGIAGGFVSSTTVTYTFTGNGNWSDASNWLNNQVPPATLNPGSTILIDPSVGGKCFLDISYTVSPGAFLTVAAGKVMELNGHLTIQ